MVRRHPSRRSFVEGWVSDTDPMLLAVIWQVKDPLEDKPFEAEVICGDEHIETLAAPTLEEVKNLLDDTYHNSDECQELLGDEAKKG